MRTLIAEKSSSRDPAAEAARAASAAIAGLPHLSVQRKRLLDMSLYLTRYGDVLCETLEELIETTSESDRAIAARLSGELVELLLAEEGFSRAFWRAFRRHLRLLRSVGRLEECERSLRETLTLAAALG